MTLLAPWAHESPGDLALSVTLADTEQYLHRFDAATLRLEQLLRSHPQSAQAWLMLATLQRVQGRYDKSDTACAALQRLNVQPHAQACIAENLALRGQFDSARSGLRGLLVGRGDDAIGAWLLTTLAELEVRAGRPAAAAQAWRAALRANPGDDYARLAMADFWIDQGQPHEAYALLAEAVRSDAVLLRLAIAAQRLGRPESSALRMELRERFEQAAQRGGRSGHEREQALWALEVERDPAAAVVAARMNAKSQREPLDLQILARAAVAAGDRAALSEAKALAQSMGLRDVRLENLR